MPDTAKYFDIRSAFWRSAFDQAADYETYLAQSPAAKADRWRAQMLALPELTVDDRERLTGHDVRLNVLLVSGVWCGDCVRQGPMLRQLAAAAGHEVELRVIDRDADTAVRDELRILGAMRVPVAVFLTDQFLEVGRFGDRMLSTYRRKAVTEVGAACALPNASTPADELAAERGEWLDVVERMLLMVRLSPITREHAPVATGA
ncbi:MAG TPA: thioredoxin family protein [Vicinamibacterales bacterium]|nr:thioredoxin family protein [Vicinamibacterales bacterium]